MTTNAESARGAALEFPKGFYGGTAKRRTRALMRIASARKGDYAESEVSHAADVLAPVHHGAHGVAPTAGCRLCWRPAGTLADGAVGAAPGA